MKTLVIGATGNIGSQIVPLLASQNIPVIPAGRNVEKLKNKFPGLECRAFDFADRATWMDALAGVERMFFVLPPGSAPEKKQAYFLAAAKGFGVGHIVFSSGRTTGPIKDSPLNVTEGIVQKSGIDWTILRPGWFMQNFINWVGFTIPKEDAFYLPAGNSKTAFVDVRDIAAVATHILQKPDGHSEKIYDLTSAKAIDHHEVAAAISRVAGREIKYVPLSENDFLKAMTDRGWTEKAIQKTTWLYGFVKKGLEEEIGSGMVDVLGREGIDFPTFARDYAKSW